LSAEDVIGVRRPPRSDGRGSLSRWCGAVERDKEPDAPVGGKLGEVLTRQLRLPVVEVRRSQMTIVRNHTIVPVGDKVRGAQVLAA
jgi:hypothetical protein